MMLSQRQQQLLLVGTVLGLGLLATVGAPVREASPPGAPRPGPTVGQVVRSIARLGFPLPGDGHAFLVVIINRTHNSASHPPDPWDDWIGILRNEGGRLIWRCAQGSGEPGWLPMWGQGRLETAPEGFSRLAIAQFAPDAYGGGYHNWRSDRPAFRQVGAIYIEIFDRESGRWRGPFISRGHHNNHTTSAPNIPLTRKRGVRDWSHGCPVVLDPHEHEANLRAGGWTPDIDGVRLSLVTLNARDLR